MSKGGFRVGAGRPTKAQAAQKAAALALAIKKGLNTSPRQYLQGLLNSRGSTKSERLKAAELLLKMPPESTLNAGGRSDVEHQPLTIFAVPHGSTFDLKTGKLELPPDAVLETIEPFTGTPAHDATQTRRERLEVTVTSLEEPEPFESPEPPAPQNVTVLRRDRIVADDGRSIDPSRRPGSGNPWKFKPFGG